MLRRQTHRKDKSIKALTNPKTHIQKKYFSLMLVPSFTGGKTRSVRIPYNALYAALGLVLFVAVFVPALSFYAQHNRQNAQQYAENLEQSQEAFEAERFRLIEEIGERDARIHEGEEVLQSTVDEIKQFHLEELEAVTAYIEALEEQVGEQTESIQAIMDMLASNRHIPAVGRAVDDLQQSHMALMSQLEVIAVPETYRIASVSLVAVPSAQGATDEAAQALFNRINHLEAHLDVNAEMYALLSSQVPQLATHIRNHPTLRPISGGRLTSGFGYRRNAMGGRGSEFHYGIDISAPTGTPILAAGGGRVVSEGWQNGYGNTVVIDHGNGIRTMYAHNSVNLVTVGQQVARGETIARVGSTGRSTGPHLHFEVIVNGTPVDPAPFVLR